MDDEDILPDREETTRMTTQKQADRLPNEEGLSISFPRHGFIHPNYATHYKHIGHGHWVKDYEQKVIQAHHLATLFPCVDYNALLDVVEGRRLLKVEANDETTDTPDEEGEFYGIRISSVVDEEE